MIKDKALAICAPALDCLKFTKKPISEYLSGNKPQSRIVVARHAVK